MSVEAPSPKEDSDSESEEDEDPRLTRCEVGERPSPKYRYIISAVRNFCLFYFITFYLIFHRKTAFRGAAPRTFTYLDLSTLDVMYIYIFLIPVIPFI